MTTIRFAGFRTSLPVLFTLPPRGGRRDYRQASEASHVLVKTRDSAGDGGGKGRDERTRRGIALLIASLLSIKWPKSSRNAAPPASTNLSCSAAQPWAACSVGVQGSGPVGSCPRRRRRQRGPSPRTVATGKRGLEATDFPQCQVRQQPTCKSWRQPLPFPLGRFNRHFDRS